MKKKENVIYISKHVFKYTSRNAVHDLWGHETVNDFILHGILLLCKNALYKINYCPHYVLVNIQYG